MARPEEAQWHLRATNPKNPVVFFGKHAAGSVDVYPVTADGADVAPLALVEPAPILRPALPADITIGGLPAGRVKMELFADITPKTAENFRQFCTGEHR
jgi:Cyclophilin type peptidyl-prolyl cis-trans isomerase/CLD